MPTYDYKCSDCGYTFELFQKMSDEPMKECPNCKGNLKRLIGAGAGPIFKGKGFYQTDYKNPPKSDKKEESKPEKKEKTANSKETASDSKNKSEEKKD